MSDVFLRYLQVLPNAIMSGTSQYNKILIQISSGKTAGSIIVIDKNDRKVYDQQSLDRPSDTPQDQANTLVKFKVTTASNANQYMLPADGIIVENSRQNSNSSKKIAKIATFSRYLAHNRTLTRKLTKLYEIQSV